MGPARAIASRGTYRAPPALDRAGESLAHPPPITRLPSPVPQRWPGADTSGRVCAACPDAAKTRSRPPVVLASASAPGGHLWRWRRRRCRWPCPRPSARRAWLAARRAPSRRAQRARTLVGCLPASAAGQARLVGVHQTRCSDRRTVGAAEEHHPASPAPASTSWEASAPSSQSASASRRSRLSTPRFCPRLWQVAMKHVRRSQEPSLTAAHRT
jgi:hypothetical protein